ncbi:olfactory receptor 11L1 [Sigmodon hispidus]
MAWSSSLKSLLTAFVFSILAVSSVDSIGCSVSSCVGTSCSPSSTCTASKECFNQIQKFDTPSVNTDRTYKEKGCSVDTCSDVEYSATLGDQRKFSYVNRCCTSENCNKEDLTVSSQSSEYNGVECPACYSEKDPKCSSVTTLKCTGKETKCVEITGTETGTSALTLFGKGCATENACNLSMKVFKDIQIKSTCISPVSNGSPTIKSISSFPIILLLLKVLL